MSRCRPSFLKTTSRRDLRRAARAGEVEPRHGHVASALVSAHQSARLDAPVRAVDGLHRLAAPVVLAELLEQFRLIALHLEDAVQAELAEQRGGRARGVQGVGDHDRADGEREDHLAQRGALGLVLLAGVAALADDHAGVDVDHGELLLGGLLARLAVRVEIVVVGPAHSLAVDRNHLGFRHLRLHPVRQDALRRVDVDVLEHVVQGGDAGRVVALRLRAQARADAAQRVLAQGAPGSRRSRSGSGSRPGARRARSSARSAAGSADHAWRAGRAPLAGLAAGTPAEGC